MSEVVAEGAVTKGRSTRVTWDPTAVTTLPGSGMFYAVVMPVPTSYTHHISAKDVTEPRPVRRVSVSLTSTDGDWAILKLTPR